MKKQLLIFGSGDIAQLAHYYFTTDSEYEVSAFVIDNEFIKEHEFCGLPIISFEDVTKNFPPEGYYFFIALSYSKLNIVRKEKFFAAKEKGYELASYISSRATVLTNKLIGENCFILENNTIQPFVEIGNNVTLWSGNHIGHHTIIRDHVFISSHVVISGGVEVGEQCFIGVNATLRDHVKVGNRCVIGAGVLLLRDAMPDGVYIGAESNRSKVPSTRLRNL